MISDTMISLGYTKEEIDKITSVMPICYLCDETFLVYIFEKFSFFRNLGLNDMEIIRLTLRLPQIFALSIDTISKKMQFMLNLGFRESTVIKITKKDPYVYSFSIDRLNQNIENIISLGYTKEEVIRMMSKLPHLIKCSVSSIKVRINDIIRLGYTYNEVIRMTATYPSIYSFSKENMKQKMDDMIRLGYTYNEVIMMTIKMPSIYGFSIDNIREKKEFYESIGLNALLLKDTKHILQSVDLSYARYMFYKSIGIDIDMTNYSKLFINQNQFFNIYGKTKEEVIDEYNYNLEKGMNKRKSR